MSEFEMLTGDTNGQAALAGTAVFVLVTAFLCERAGLVGEARRKGKRLLACLHVLNIIGLASFGFALLTMLALIWTGHDQAAFVCMIVAGLTLALLLTGHVSYFVCVGVVNLLDLLIGDIPIV